MVIEKLLAKARADEPVFITEVDSFFKNLRYVWLAVKVRLKPVPRDEAKQKK